MIRRAWPEILGYLEEHSRLVWMLVSQNASVAGFDGQLLTIGFSGDGPRDTVQRRGGDQVIAQAVHSVLGIQPQLDLITGGAAPAGGSSPKAEGRPAPAAPRPKVPQSEVPQSQVPQPEVPRPQPVQPHQPQQPGQPAAARTEHTPAAVEQPGRAPTAVESPLAAPSDGPGAESARTAAPLSETSLSDASTPDGPEPEMSAEEDSDELSEGSERSEPVEEAATGPGTPAESEDLETDDVPVSDWYGSDLRHPDDDVPPPPDEDEPEPYDDGGFARQWGGEPDPVPAPGGTTIPRPEPGGAPIPRPAPGDVPRPAPATGPIPRPEPGLGGIPSFAKPEAELKAEFEARFASARRGGGSATSPDRPEDPPSSMEAPVAQPAAAPAMAAGTPHHRRASRFQQMMEQYNQTQDGGTAPGTAGDPGQHGVPQPAGPASGTVAADPGGANGSAARGSVNWSDDVPSEDDVTIEESGMAGRKVVERLLGARFIEERMLDGTPLS
jgi:DNA polymerase III subunit gamma/tau